MQKVLRATILLFFVGTKNCQKQWFTFTFTFHFLMYLTDCIFTFMQENECKPGLFTNKLIITNFTSKLHNYFI